MGEGKLTKNIGEAQIYMSSAQAIVLLFLTKIV